MRYPLSIAVVALATLTASQLPAQSYAVRGSNNGTPVIQHHASTFLEGARRGAADLWRAWGDYNYSTSLAHINNQEAARRALENHKQYVNDYFELRELNRTARALENGPKPTPEDLARRAQQGLPERLAADQFDANSGELYWPALLEHPQFAAEREAIEQLMAARTPTDSGLGSPSHSLIRTLVAQMQQKLRTRLGTVSPMEYMEVKTYLDSVAYEAAQELPIRGIAGN